MFHITYFSNSIVLGYIFSFAVKCCWMKKRSSNLKENRECEWRGGIWYFMAREMKWKAENDHSALLTGFFLKISAYYAGYAETRNLIVAILFMVVHHSGENIYQNSAIAYALLCLRGGDSTLEGSANKRNTEQVEEICFNPCWILPRTKLRESESIIHHAETQITRKKWHFPFFLSNISTYLWRIVYTNSCSLCKTCDFAMWSSVNHSGPD